MPNPHSASAPAAVPPDSIHSPDKLAPAAPSAGSGKSDIGYSPEEYRFYFDTTEKVIDRRHALNTWNYGICLAMVGAVAVIVNTMLSRPELRLALIATILLLSVLGIILCWFWLAQLRDLKRLNKAKFEVLNGMAPNVKFPDGTISFEPFRKEWEKLESDGALVSGRIIGTKVLNSSKAEFVLPGAFITMFILMFLVAASISWQNWNSLSTKPLNLPTAESSPDFTYKPGTLDQ